MPQDYRRAETAALIARLLAHYWTAEEPAAVRTAIAEDWLDDLGQFSPAIVEAACREYRLRPGGRRPTPGDIRQLCIEAQPAERERLAIEHRLSALDEETRRMWSAPEYHGDYRSPDQRRNDAIERQEEKYRRGSACRAGKLDEYDAEHWPERLAERRGRAAATEQAATGDMRPIGDVLAQMGVTNTETTVVTEATERVE